MLRVLEPEIMDTRRDAEEYDAMDFSEANARCAEDAIALLRRLPEARVLDIGVGTGEIPLFMLQKNADMEILAVDLAEEMLHVATKKILGAGFGDRCKLAKMDAKKLRVPDAKYDLVMCASTIHHIPDPLVVFQEIARVVKPTGAVLVRDLIRPTSMDEAWTTVKRVAAGEHIRQQQLFFDSLCAALEIPEVEALVKKSGLARVSVSRCSDRHWSAERPVTRSSGRP
jgi:ubiquinone/menaquinone biosynthesis C-methylase UbiE